MSSSPDTHGATGEPWIGFDLDGTLAVYDKWEGIDHIGAPVAPMVELIKKLHADGKTVKILTARVAPRENPEKPVANVYCGRPAPWTQDALMNMFDRKADAMEFAGMYSAETWGPREFMIDWCVNYLGFVPEITHQKDHLMVTLYDDRVKQVIPNDGTLVEELAQSMFTALKKSEFDLGCATVRLARKWNTFICGMMLGWLLAILILFGYEGIKAWRQRDNAVYRRADEVRTAGVRLLEVLPAAWTTNGTELVAP